MNSRTFFRKIVELYHDGRIPLFKDRALFRGRSRSVSSAVEDLFAKFIISNTNIDKIYIDQPVNTIGFNKQIYPDLVIIKNNKVIQLIDLKMDMGWNRDGLLSLCDKHQSIVKNVKGEELKIRDGLSKEDVFYKYSNKLVYNIVIISSKNISYEKLDKQIKASKKRNKNVNVYVLSSKAHPNIYKYTVKEMINKISIDDKQIDKLLKSIN
jgi:hypothetical protein